MWCVSVLVASVAAIAWTALADSGSAQPRHAAIPAHSRGTNIPLKCPSDYDPPGGIVFSLKVVKWCAEDGVRKQAQIKLQLSIENKSDRPLDIGLHHIRLVLDHFDPTLWSPPKVGNPTTEMPFTVPYKGDRYWTIPANAERAYDVKGGGRTFATHWNVTSLAPRATFRPVDHKTGAAVFYVPRGRKAPRELEHVIGVAYMVGRKIKLLCRQRGWGPPESATDF